jgi:4-oxalocrotonate tautomerase
MPMITIQVAAAPAPALAAALERTVVELTARWLAKDPAVTAVAVEFLDPNHWFSGGMSCAESGRSAFFVDVRITDGTNTKDQKVRYIAETFAALDTLLGGVMPESCVHVDDVRADGYGYGGLTQERRFIETRATALAARA